MQARLEDENRAKEVARDNLMAADRKAHSNQEHIILHSNSNKYKTSKAVEPQAFRGLGGGGADK